MKFRSMILVLTIAFSAIFVSMIGTSYAYYVATDGTSIEVTTGNIDNSATVVFEETQYININNAIPTSKALGEDYCFQIIPNPNILGDKEVFMEIGITDIYIDEELKTSDFKYETYCVGIDFGGVSFGNGTGINFNDEVIAKKYLPIFDTSLFLLEGANNPLDCCLTIWIQETDENQNHLMNKKFRGKIKVTTLYK